MCIRKLIIVAILSLLFIPNAYAGVAENYEWQMSDSAEFTSYEPCGYGKELVLTKGLYGKYIRFVHTDFYGNTNISDVKGPVKYDGKNIITFDGNNWVVEDKESDEHYVKCSDGRLWAVNPDMETVSDNAIITLTDVADSVDKRILFELGAQQPHQRMKLFFQNDAKENVFTMWVIRRADDKLYLLDDGSSQFSTKIHKADIGDSMEVMLGFDFINSKVYMKNKVGKFWSDEIAVSVNLEGLKVKNIAYIKVCNEYTPCNAWVDNVRLLENDTRNEQNRFGIWGQRDVADKTVAEVYNYSRIPVDVKVMCAFYEGNRLKDVKIINKFIEEDTEEFEFVSSESYDNVKFFVWDGEKEQYPLSLSYEY